MYRAGPARTDAPPFCLSARTGPLMCQPLEQELQELQRLQRLQPQQRLYPHDVVLPVDVPATEPLELPQPQVFELLLLSDVPATELPELRQQGLQQELATKPGKTIPKPELHIEVPP